MTLTCAGAYVTYLAGTLVAGTGTYLAGTLVAGTGTYLAGTLVAGTGRTSSSRAPCNVAMRPPAISMLAPPRRRRRRRLIDAGRTVSCVRRLCGVFVVTVWGHACTVTVLWLSWSPVRVRCVS